MAWSLGGFGRDVLDGGVVFDGVWMGSTIKDKVTLWKIKDNFIWIKLHGSVLGTAAEVAFGATYIPPYSEDKIQHVTARDQFTEIVRI